MSSRIDGAWSDPVNLGPAARSPGLDWEPVLSPAGDRVFITSARDGGVGGTDIWVVGRTAGDADCDSIPDGDGIGDACEPPGLPGGLVVESKSVEIGAAGVTVGLYLTNDVDITGLVVPLEIREITPGSYVANSFALTVQGRVAASGHLDFTSLRYYPEPDGNPACGGPVSSSYFTGVGTAGGTFFSSPSAVMWTGLNTTSPCLAAGSDGNPGVGTPSFLLTFDVADQTGAFEIDTACVRPANHLAMVDCHLTQLVPMAFTKGVVIIESCPCLCQGDPTIDGLTSITDVTTVIGIAFRGEPVVPDPAAGCSRSTTDVDCSGVTDLIDVVKMIDVAFRGVMRQQAYCAPCSQP